MKVTIDNSQLEVDQEVFVVSVHNYYWSKPKTVYDTFTIKDINKSSIRLSNGRRFKYLKTKPLTSRDDLLGVTYTLYSSKEQYSLYKDAINQKKLEKITSKMKNNLSELTCSNMTVDYGNNLTELEDAVDMVIKITNTLKKR